MRVRPVVETRYTFGDCKVQKFKMREISIRELGLEEQAAA